ncbi:DUF1565 domain-containing protein [Leptospira weilii]|uniref:LIC10774 family surface protein n=2 Tax=Leptospira weilii TaxID=28184 RepID=UPI00201B653B|nr:DUF1565 domain-containing protein [Leptospira weilii]UPY78688.1 DUF1565 domain-containing protein [Leptospira weilii]
MKQIFSIFFITLLLAECAGESNDSSQLLLEIANQKSLNFSPPERNASGMAIIDIPTHYVDSISGSDVYPGTKSAPYRTITKALSASEADGTKVIYVAPGTYDTSIGETFPMYIPEDVNLYGDYEGKGLVGGSSSFYAGPPGTTPKTGPTWIKGGGIVDLYHTTLIPKDNSQIAGFKITNPNSEPPEVHQTSGIFVKYGSLMIRNNTITGMPVGYGILIYYNGGVYISSLISGNQLTYNYLGIANYSGSRIYYDKAENNVISRNYVGIFTESGLDLGGGPAKSEGNNTISCNSYVDTWIPGTANNPQILFAKNNYWDHFPPQMSFPHPDKAGLDISHMSKATVVRYEEGSVAPNRCN